MSTFTQEMVLERELAVALDLWFMKAMVSPGKRRASPVWAVMRNRLKVLGNWKNQPRGNPAKGFKVSREKMNK